MKNVLIIFLLFFFGTSFTFSQENCKEYKEGFIPKNLNEAIEFLSCQWSESDKTEFKKKAEKDAVIELHFGTGMDIRNGWDLWKGKNQISLFFKSRGISHPDDMSSIILTSFHRKLNNKPIELDKQTSYYKEYWKEIKNKKKNLKKKFKELKTGEIVKVPLSGKYGWRSDGTDRTTLTIYSNTVENSRDFDCVVEGVIVFKRKKRKNYFLTIKLINMERCKFKNPIYNKKEVLVGELLEINMAYQKIIIE